MKRLNPRDRDFIERRRFFARWGTPVGIALIVALAVLGWYLSMTSPLLANPVYSAQQIQSGAIDLGTLQMMALMAPLLFLTALGLTTVGAIFLIIAMGNERRLIDILDRQLEKDSPQEPTSRLEGIFTGKRR